MCHLEMLYLPVKVKEPSEMFYVSPCLHCSQNTSVGALLERVFVCLRVGGTLPFGPPSPFVSIALTTVLEGDSVIQ